MSDPAETRMYAIVVKGPLLRFTANVLSYYASRAKDTVVIFSHNNGSCFTPVRAAVLRGLEQRFAPNLASTIHPMPARRGLNHRNVQREACYHGVRLAIQAFRAQYILIHRHDSVFQAATVLPDLVTLLEAQPPPAVPMPGGRIGFCPWQFQFSDAHGRYHLDDHCSFGRAAGVLHYWSTDNIFYNSSADEWSRRHGNLRTPDRCRGPGAESDNGFIWVMDDSVRRGLPPPANTSELIAQRAFVLNPASWDYVCMRGRAQRNISLPAPAALSKMQPAILAPLNPFGVHRQCRERARYYDCAQVGPVQNRTDTPMWACVASNTRC